MKVRYQTKVISEQKSAPFSLSLSKCKSAKSEANLRHDEVVGDDALGIPLSK